MITRPIYLTDESIKEVIKFSYGLSLGSIWHNLRGRASAHEEDDLKQCKEAFFYIAEQLITEGKLKLADSGRFLEGSITEQLQQFRDVWPEEIDKTVMEKDIDNLWWLVAAPAGAVWIKDDGDEIWA